MAEAVDGKPGERRLPENIQTGRSYRGGNSVYVSVTQTAKGYSDNRWATYKQIKDMGGQVRKGEKATHVLYYKFDDERKEQQPGALDKPATSPDRPAERERTRPPNNHRTGRDDDTRLFHRKFAHRRQARLLKGSRRIYSTCTDDKYN